MRVFLRLGGFQFTDSPLEIRYPPAGSLEYPLLHLEVLARDQVEPVEERRQQGPDILADVLRWRIGQDIGDPGADLVNETRVDHEGRQCDEVWIG